MFVSRVFYEWENFLLETRWICKDMFGFYWEFNGHSNVNNNNNHYVDWDFIMMIFWELLCSVTKFKKSFWPYRVKIEESNPSNNKLVRHQGIIILNFIFNFMPDERKWMRVKKSQTQGRHGGKKFSSINIFKFKWRKELSGLFLRRPLASDKFEHYLNKKCMCT